jgi:hypothetical protein
VLFIDAVMLALAFTLVVSELGAAAVGHIVTPPSGIPVFGPKLPE